MRKRLVSRTPAVLAGCIAVAFARDSASAQSGAVIYDWAATSPAAAEGEMAAVRDIFANQGRARFILHFGAGGSLLTRIKEEENPGEGPRAVFQPTSANLDVLATILEAHYADEPNVLREAWIGEDRTSAARVLSAGGERYRLEGAPVEVAWTVTGEWSEHAGHRVNRAVGETMGMQVEAWFAPEIPVPGGPGLYGGLPGLILVLILEEGRMVWAATEVSLEEVEEERIRMPREGTAISEEAYREAVAEGIRQVQRFIRRMAGAQRGVKCAVGTRVRGLQCYRSGGGGAPKGVQGGRQGVFKGVAPTGARPTGGRVSRGFDSHRLRSLNGEGRPLSPHRVFGFVRWSSAAGQDRLVKVPEIHPRG